MSSYHQWIADVGTLSYHDKFMKEEMENGNMQEYIFVVDYASWSVKTKQRDTILWQQLNTWCHWRLLTSKSYGGEQKSILKKTHSKKK